MSKLTRRQILAGLAATAVACGPTPIERRPAGTHDLRDRIGGKNRSSVLIVPDGLHALAPLVIGLHDLGGDPEDVHEGHGWREECARRGWLGVFPAYGKPNWDEDNVYITHLAIRATALGGGDPKRVFVVGHGAGGRRAYAMACSNPGWTTAIVAGAAAVRFREKDLGFQEPKPPAVSVLHLHGGRDERVPVTGGPLACGDRKTRQVLPLREGLQPWIDQIGAASASMTLRVPATAVGTRWTAGGRDIVQLIDPNQDHSWNRDYWTRVGADFLAAAPRRVPLETSL